MAPCGGDVLDGAVVAILPALTAHAGVLRGSLHDLAVVRRRCVRCSVVVARRNRCRSRLWWSWSGRGMERGCGRSAVRHVPHAPRENRGTPLWHTSPEGRSPRALAQDIRTHVMTMQHSGNIITQLGPKGLQMVYMAIKA